MWQLLSKLRFQIFYWVSTHLPTTTTRTSNQQAAWVAKGCRGSECLKEVILSKLKTGGNKWNKTHSTMHNPSYLSCCIYLMKNQTLPRSIISKYCSLQKKNKPQTTLKTTCIGQHQSKNQSLEFRLGMGVRRNSEKALCIYFPSSTAYSYLPSNICFSEPELCH